MYQPSGTCYYSSFIPNYEDQHELSNSNSRSIDPKKKSTGRSKHIPHHLRPQHIVERRNIRERRRVQDVNQAFYILKAILPFDTINDTTDELNYNRISKVCTLLKAMDYIKALENMLNENN